MGTRFATSPCIRTSMRTASSSRGLRRPTSGEPERQIWDLRHDLFEIVNHPADYEFRIAQQFRATDNDSTQGLHQGRDQRIIVHRDVLTDASTFLGVLLHELAHTRTPFPDQTGNSRTRLPTFSARSDRWLYTKSNPESKHPVETTAYSPGFPRTMDESTSDLYPRIEQSADMSHGTLAIDVETACSL